MKKCKARGRTRLWPISPSTRRALFEAVEPRLLFHGPADDGDGDIPDLPPILPDLLVDPAHDLQAPQADRFNPVTWATAPSGLPILNSLPGAPTAVYLDFDGDTGSGTTAYSEDADATTYDATEQANIVEAWRQIAAYYAMFDTNVTTVYTAATPKVWNILGNNAGGATGGYAYVNTFPNNSPNAFNTSSNARSRQSGMAHEIGHVFGLNHQSAYDLLANKTAEYINAPDSLHGAIMGVDYSGSVHKFFIGHSATSPGTLQDDIKVIAGKIKAKEPAGGDGFRPDDFPGTIAAATPLADNAAGLQYASGIVERMDDIDAFSFVANGGAFAVAAVPDAPSGLDARLEIYDADGHLLAARDAATNEQRLTLTLPAGTYYALVASHGDYGDLGMYDLSVRALPAGWNTTDVGATVLVGHTTYDAATGLFTNAGAGPDITGTTDQFHYAYQSLTGDGEIVARVTQNQNTGAAARAGLDIRDALTENAKHAAIVLNPAGGAELISRAAAGGTALTSANNAGSVPRWLKLTRAGNVLTGFASPDGVDWTQIGQATVPLGTTAYVGLLTTAGTTGKLNVATFDNVAITGDTAAAPPAYNALPAPADLAVAPAPTGVGLALSWTDVPGSTGYAVQRSADGITFTQVGTTAAGVVTYTDASPGATMRYFYRVAAKDASGASIPSAVASAANRPTAPTGVAVTAWNTSNLVINWKDVSGDAGYRVERSTDGGLNFTPLATVGVNVPSYTDSGLATATPYLYRIVTLSNLGDSAPSSNATGATRLPAVGGLAFDAVTANNVTFHWTDLAAETGYRVERSLDGTTWSTLANVAANVTTYADAAVAAVKEYYYRVFGTAGQALSLNPSSYIFTATPDTGTLPPPWVAANIGTTTGGGATGYAAGTFNFVSGGSDINLTGDNFRYTYQPLTGDGQIVARIAAVENTDTNAKVGVMIRASTANTAPNVSVLLTSGAGILLQSRATVSGTTTVTAGSTSARPAYWVKLVRAGNTFTGYSSPDNVTWTQVGTPLTIAMGTSVLIGLASTSHSTTKLGAASATNVTVSNAPPTVATPAKASPAAVTTGTTTALSVLGADDHGEANLTYTWSLTAQPAGAPAPTFSANATNAAKASTATFAAPGDYTFLVTIADTSGQSVTSSVTVNVAAKPAVTLSSFDYRNRLSFTFDKDVSASLSLDDLTVQPQPTGPALAPTSFDWDPATKTATFTFSADFADGNYRATLLAAGLFDATSLHPTANTTFDFFALWGDLDHDRQVGFSDLVIVAQNYDATNATLAQGDLDGDGTVGFTDLTIIAQRYDQSLLPPAPPPAPAAPVAAPAAAASANFSTTPISITKDPTSGDVLRKRRKPIEAAPPKHRKQPTGNSRRHAAAAGPM